MSLQLVDPKSSEPIVAIDGPAGAGKSTAARLLAFQFDFVLIDTGALYRSLAMMAMEREISLNDGPALAALCDSLKFQFGKLERTASGIPRLRIWVNGSEVTDLIRTPELGLAASQVSKHPEVRDALLEVQRAFGRDGGIVMEGRDIGTVIFPHAEIKFYLTASVDSRARRRHEELTQQGIEISLEQIKKETQARDEQDMRREVAPLRQASDAVLIDSSHLTLDQVVAEMASIVKEHMAQYHK